MTPRARAAALEYLSACLNGEKTSVIIRLANIFMELNRPVGYGRQTIH